MLTEFKSINPYTEELLASFVAISPKDIESELNQMKLAQLSWRNLPIKKRIAFLPKLA
jgi:acyl-CoA reductase-like NAD-dependent aldehyde dehydrogenase